MLQSFLDMGRLFSIELLLVTTAVVCCASTDRDGEACKSGLQPNMGEFVVFTIQDRDNPGRHLNYVGMVTKQFELFVRK